MTAVEPQSVVPRPFPPVQLPRGSRFLGYLSTTDPKGLGVARRGTPAARLGTLAGQRVQPARGHRNAVDRPQRRPGHISATRPPAGRFSWRGSGRLPAPSTGSRSVRGATTSERAEQTEARPTGKERSFERHEYGFGFTGTDDPAGGDGRGHGPVPVQHPALEIPAPPRPHRGTRRPGPPVDRDRPGGPGTADRLRRGAVQPPAGGARARGDSGRVPGARRCARRTGRHPARRPE
jgi:hypothetical protein